MIILYSNLGAISFLQGSFTSTGLVVSSKLPRFSDMYTLTIASADSESISANEPVHFTKSVTEWSLSFPLSHHYISLGIHTHRHWRSESVCMHLLHCFSEIKMHVYFCLNCRFTKDGVLVEGLFWKDVEALIDQYTNEPKKNK